MDGIEELIKQAEKNGGWDDKLTEEYFRIQESEFTQDNDGHTIRHYEPKDRQTFTELISTVGDYSVEEIEDEGCDINILDINRTAAGAIVYREDGVGTYINAIAVDPQFRGKGYAARLIASIDDGRPLSAKIFTHNESSMRAFEKYGFSHSYVEDGKRWMVRE